MSPESLRKIFALTKQRILQHPEVSFFHSAIRELTLIESEFQEKGRVDMTFYNSLSIGMMCAKELEANDPVYCEAAYEMLEDIRPK